ncbi:hypothetical protein XENOCAPTIV_015905 [Xenoophorus captivus]|uniref:Uncharacterized protein n=1 Tax=Xenoophorus captivus TaxID=1517983 RepID=A0ABV0QBX3_9TELE
MVPPPNFALGIVCSVLVFPSTHFAYRPETSVLVTSDQSTFFSMTAVPYMACGKLQMGSSLLLSNSALQKHSYSLNFPTFYPVTTGNCKSRLTLGVPQGSVPGP